MNARTVGAGWLAGVLAMMAVAARAAEPAADPEMMKVAMVSDGGTFDDAGFNQVSKEGLDRAMREFGLFCYFRNGRGERQYARKLTEMAEKDYRLIVGVGYRMRGAIAQIAARYTNTWFMIVDGNYEKPLPNVFSLTFEVEQCALPAGYLAAAWADLEDPGDPQVGFVGGNEVDPVTRFTGAYRAGAKLYNKRHEKDVKIVGEYLGSFTAYEKGKKTAARMIEEGVDVIFGVGGKTGNGAIAAARLHNRWAIGVDTDQYYSLSDDQSAILTSCMKMMDQAVYEAVRAAADGKFYGGRAYKGTLENGGVGLAPFHDYEDSIPNSLKRELKEIQADIVSGKLRP